jgi:hypothetical protein
MKFTVSDEYWKVSENYACFPWNNAVASLGPCYTRERRKLLIRLAHRLFLALFYIGHERTQRPLRVKRLRTGYRVVNCVAP